ncbi:TPA: hypothetical protein ACOEHI_003839 [Enterobacter kobei]
MSTRKEKYFDLDEAIEAGTPLGISKTGNYAEIAGHNIPDSVKIRGDFNSVAQDMRRRSETQRCIVEHLRPQEQYPGDGEWKRSRSSSGFERPAATVKVNEKAQQLGFGAGLKDGIPGRVSIAASLKKSTSKQTNNDKGSDNGHVRGRENSGDYAFSKYAELYQRTKR